MKAGPDGGGDGPGTVGTFGHVERLVAETVAGAARIDLHLLGIGGGNAEGDGAVGVELWVLAAADGGGGGTIARGIRGCQREG